MQEELVKCPCCCSTQIHADKKGFSAGKAVAGALVGGLLVGAATGSIGKNKIVLTCLKCGHSFKIGEAPSERNQSSDGYVGYSSSSTYQCSRCGKISTVSDSSYCPKCGNRFSGDDVYSPPQKSKAWIYIVAVIVAVVLIAIIAS